MEFDLVFFGVNLLPFVLGIVALLRAETGVSDYVADWVLALLLSLAAVASIVEIQTYLMGLVGAELTFKVIITFLGVLLTTKGYWPSARVRVAGLVQELPKRLFTSKY